MTILSKNTMIFAIMLTGGQILAQSPSFSVDGETLYTKDYSLIKSHPHGRIRVDTTSRSRSNAICSWGEEIRLTHFLDSSTYVAGPDVASSGDSVAVSFDVQPGGRPRPGSKLMFSQDFGSNWTTAEYYPGGGGSYITDLKIANNRLLAGGVTNRYYPQASTPHFRSRWGFDGVWSDPHYFLANDIYFLRGPKFALSSDIVHLAFWQWDRVNDYQVEIDSFYYFKGDQYGSRWWSGVPVAYAPGAGQSPFCLVISGGVISIVFKDYASLQNPTDEIFQLYSTDYGQSWSRRMLSTDDSIHSQLPAAASSPDGKVIVTWMDYRYGSGPSEFTGDILSRTSTDGGIDWGPETRVTHDSLAMGSMPFISEDAIGVASENYRRFMASEIYYTESRDNGATWSDNQRLTYADNASTSPRFVVNGQRVILFWLDSRDGTDFQYELYMRRYDIEDDIGDGPKSIPSEVSLLAYPNPFNSSVLLSISNPKGGELEIRIYDIQGRIVKSFNRGDQGGDEKIVWDATDASGKKVSSGIYFAKARTNFGERTIKLLYIK